MIDYIPKEAEEQTSFFQWLYLKSVKHPELKYAFAIPNGGSRHRLEAKNLKAQGVKSGVPDIFLPLARKGKHGLFIEMKRRKNSHTSPEQKEYLAYLQSQGYEAKVCKGLDDAIALTEDYLKE